MAVLDDKDCAILDLLQREGDLPNIELARRMQLSPAATLRRVQRLRGDGVITAVRAHVDPEKVGARVEAFVLVALAEHSEASDARFAAALAEIPPCCAPTPSPGPTTSCCTSPPPMPANSKLCSAPCLGSVHAA